MKICCISDLHLTNRKPSCRKDDFLETQFRKLEFIFKTTEENGGVLCIGGDVFDRPNEPYSLVSKFIDLRNKYNILVYVVAGQHDMHFHNPDLSNTPLGVLDRVCIVSVLDQEEQQGNIFVGKSWGDEYKKGDVLITHEMVVKNKPLFQDQENYTLAKSLLKKCKFVLSGDNHNQFEFKYQGRLLINPGSVTRLKRDQKNHKPAIYVVDLETNEYEKIYIPVEKDVFKKELRIPEISIDPEIQKKILVLSDKIKNNDKKEIIKFKEMIDRNLKIAISEEEREMVQEKIKEFFNE